MPVILLTIFWRGFNATGAVTGLSVGLACSLGLLLIGPTVLGTQALFPLANIGIVSIPTGLLAAVARIAPRQRPRHASHGL